MQNKIHGSCFVWILTWCVCAAGLSVCTQAGQYVGVISLGYETMQDIVIEFGYNFIMWHKWCNYLNLADDSTHSNTWL